MWTFRCRGRHESSFSFRGPGCADFIVGMLISLVALPAYTYIARPSERSSLSLGLAGTGAIAILLWQCRLDGGSS